MSLKFSLFAIFCFLSILLSGQPGLNISEKLEDQRDSLVQQEVATFTIAGSTLNETNASASKIKLTEIAISRCNDKEVSFSASRFTGSVSTFIHLYFKEESSVSRTLDSIFLVTHSHYLVRLPRPVVHGLLQANTCRFDGGTKKSAFLSPFFKAFYSNDRKRLYIYMLGGNDVNKYEVTWVIVQDKYYTRILNTLL